MFAFLLKFLKTSTPSWRLPPKFHSMSQVRSPARHMLADARAVRAELDVIIAKRPERRHGADEAGNRRPFEPRVNVARHERPDDRCRTARPPCQGCGGQPGVLCGSWDRDPPNDWLSALCLQSAASSINRR